MKVNVTPYMNDNFEVQGWTSSTPDSVVNTVKKILKAAAAVWPELDKIKVVEGRKNK